MVKNNFSFYSSLRNLIKLRTCKTKRLSSYDKSGGNIDFIKIEAQSKVTLAEIDGAGCLTHIWMTVSCEDILYPRKVLLRMYWDEEVEPSVDVPLGDFFGVGHGVLNHYVSLPLSIIKRKDSKTKRDDNSGALNCYFPMPFSKKARIEIVNECSVELKALYFHINYELYDTHLPDDILRFHAQWRREKPTKGLDISKIKNLNELWKIPNLDGKENYIILEAEGKGHYVGCNLSIDNIDPLPQFGWFGEGDDMIFIDGEKFPPSFHGTGTEDYFCSAWGFPSGEYSGLYHGVSLAGNIEDWSGKWTLYRFHIEDPICFTKSILVTIEHGHANCHSNDYSSTAYWYQTEPHKQFPPMLPVEERLPLSEKESKKSFYSKI